MHVVPALLLALQAAAASPPACAAPEHRQFDFWVGEWDVYPTGTDKLVAKSRIERLHDGCVIREQWMPIGRGGGSSLNNYDPNARRWRQTWVDSSNARVEFEGGMEGGAMVLSGFWKDVNGPGQDGTIRMRYTREKDGAVRQLGEVSTDGGRSWSPSFDFTYRPRERGADADDRGLRSQAAGRD